MGRGGGCAGPGRGPSPPSRPVPGPDRLPRGRSGLALRGRGRRLLGCRALDRRSRDRRLSCPRGLPGCVRGTLDGLATHRRSGGGRRHRSRSADRTRCDRACSLFARRLRQRPAVRGEPGGRPARRDHASAARHRRRDPRERGSDRARRAGDRSRRRGRGDGVPRVLSGITLATLATGRPLGVPSPAARRVAGRQWIGSNDRVRGFRAWRGRADRGSGYRDPGRDARRATPAGGE
jgi:hypothetical protein